MNEKEILVSIIVPVFNKEGCLKNCVESILTQSYTNIEVILVNDGSTDTSGLICNDFATKDKRVKVIHKKNGGASSARNIGIGISSGEYILFVDSDDRIGHNYVLNYITNCDSDIVIGSYTDMSGEHFDNIVEQRFVSSDNKIIQDFADNFLWMMNCKSPCMKLLKTKIIKDNNILFNCNFHYGEDYLFCLDYYCHCSSFRLINNREYEYFWYNNNVLDEKYTLTIDYINKLLKATEVLFDKFNETFSVKVNRIKEYRLKLCKINISCFDSNNHLDDYYNTYKYYIPQSTLKDAINDQLCSPYYRLYKKICNRNLSYADWVLFAKKWTLVSNHANNNNIKIQKITAKQRLLLISLKLSLFRTGFFICNLKKR